MWFDLPLYAVQCSSPESRPLFLFRNDATGIAILLGEIVAYLPGAELAGRHLREILDSTLALLENCPGHCDRSCESCLRHYHNQYLKERLDRKLGAQLLRYALSGQAPGEASIQEQSRALSPLRRLLELDGFTCTESTRLNGVNVPLLVRKNDKQMAVGMQSGLLDESWQGHSMFSLIGGRRPVGRILNEYVLKRNLPDEHQLVRERV
jgi:hypothetical protein